MFHTDLRCHLYAHMTRKCFGKVNNVLSHASRTGTGLIVDLLIFNSGKVNRHSSSIIKIMTGEMDERILGSGARPKTAMRKPSQESVLTSDGNQSDVPLPREEDNTFTMDAFWADLGVDIPPPQSQDNKQGYSSNQDDFDLNMDDEDDFEL